MSETEVELLRKENEALKQQNKELQERLSAYTNSDSHKRYYESHSTEVKEKAKVYLGKLKESNPEKLKEYRHTAYLNRKAKLQEQKNKEENEK
jgi:cell division septum initiation protein DivIVA